MDDALAQLLGFSPDEAQRATMRRMIELVHPDDREKLALTVKRSREQGSNFDAECRMPRPGGRMLWLASKGRVELDGLGRPRQLFGACVDVTQHKRLEEELRQAQKMEAIGRLAGGVAHDFNNLLTVILGQASILAARSDLPVGVPGALSEIISAGDRAASLTAQLLAFGRRQAMQAKPVNLNDVIASVSQMLHRLLGENVTLHTELSTCAPRLQADANMLTQVLLNLALNARDAMPAGGQLTIRTSCEVLDEIDARNMPEARAGSWACLSVSDTGTGIPPEVLPRIFEPIFTTKEVGKGTGLGLSTVYGIVKQHQGWIGVESALGRGTTFKVYMPPLASEGEPIGSAGAHGAERGRGELILLVEDEAAVRLVVSSILEQHGYRLLVVEDGLCALEAFAAHGHEVALLLTDVVMPRGLSGTQLAAQLQAQKPGLPIILCSGYSADRLDQDARTLPRSAFLQKPYRSEQLLDLVRRMLDEA
jgi:PAS domain S-box-containing protein